MDKKTFGIGMLSLSAMVMLMVVYFTSSPAQALVSVRDNDYSMVTARGQQTGDSLYVLDNRSGRVAVFSYDPSARTIRPKYVADMGVIFSHNKQQQRQR